MMFLESATRALPESIESLDLSYLGQKLLDDDAFEAQRRNGEQLWDEARVTRALHEYKQFLALMQWYSEAALTPSEDIDDVWHTHVLDTARYQADCETIFGCFQHHSPTSGTSEEVQDQHLNDRDETQQLFEESFGEVPQSYNITVERRCGRTVERRCGRTVDRRCGRMVADRRCGRKTANRRCGRTAERRCGRVVDRPTAMSCPNSNHESGLRIFRSPDSVVLWARVRTEQGGSSPGCLPRMSTASLKPHLLHWFPIEMPL
jgi:hypothetical protein